MNAERMPSAASIPKERSAAMSLKRFAANAAMVVIEVSMMARPTLDRVISAEASDDFFIARSSL